MAHGVHVSINARFRIQIDHGSEVGTNLGWVANSKVHHRACQHSVKGISNVFLNANNPAGRTALPGALGCRFNHVFHRLFEQGGRIHDHRIQTARLCDKRNCASSGRGQCRGNSLGGLR